MPDPLVWLNGKLTPTDRPCLLPTDRGMLYGDGLFETIRIYQRRLFLLDAHFQRLAAAALQLRLSVPPFERVRDGAHQLIAANGRDDGFLRMTLTRGPTSGLDSTLEGSPTLLLTTGPLRPNSNQPWRLVTVSIRREANALLSGIKSLNFLPNILARFEVKDQGADEGLMVNTQGAVAEGTISNLFWIAGTTLFTPSLACGVLPGITRAVTLNLAQEIGMTVQEGVFFPDELARAEGVFLTNALIEITPVSLFDGKPTRDTGLPAIDRLKTAYREKVSREIGITL